MCNGELFLSFQQKKMKIFILIGLCFASFSAFSQDWKITGDTLRLANGATFVKGQRVKVGYGSDVNKNFVYITTNPSGFSGTNTVSYRMANRSLEIYDIKEVKNKRIGDKVYLLLNGGAISKLWCDIVAAIDQKEVIVP
jgi:hypothetical protein